MRNLSRYVVIALFAVIAMDAAQAAQWAKSYVGIGYPASVRPTADGGYIAAGNTLALDAWVIKLDAGGEASWLKTFDRMIGGGAHPTADGGYIVGGLAFSADKAESALLMKLDASGSIVWKKSYSDSAATFNYTLEPTFDGGYIATGSRRGGYLATFWVMKLDANGDVVWQKTYAGTSDNDAITSAQQTADGGYIVAGGVSSFGAGNVDAWLMKLNGGGDVIWQKTYGGVGDEYAAWIQPTGDGGYIVAGSTHDLRLGQRSAWALRLDGVGNVIWQRAFGNTGLEARFGSTRETTDGGFVMSGELSFPDTDVSNILVIKLNDRGEVVWQWTDGINGPRYAGLVLLAADGGYVVAGSSFGKDTWVLKLDADGTIPGCGMMRTSNLVAIETSATVRDGTASLSAGNARPTAAGFTQRDSVVKPGTQCYFEGPSATVVEFYHAAFDHYFITWMQDEIAILDAGTRIRGWTRTGYSFKTYATAQSGTSPVCRYYIPPELGDSHFFGRGILECTATGQGNPGFVLEDPSFMHMYLPTAGRCPPSTTQVHRVFSNRPDANHRYMTDRVVRDQMVAKGWLAEGDGPDLVVMCAPQ